MPAEREHLKQADGIERVRALLVPHRERAEARQWEVVLLFYSALHWVEAWFATAGVHNRRHDDRDLAMTRVAELRRLQRVYRDLRTDSENARYQSWRPTPRELAQDERGDAQVVESVRRLLRRRP